MEEQHITELQDRVIDCLRVLFDRVEKDDDWRALGSLYYLEGYFLAMMKDLTKRKEAGK